MALDLLQELESSDVDWKAAIPELEQLSGLNLKWLLKKDYRAVTSIDQLYELRDYLKDKEFIAIDTETLGLLYTDKTVSVQICAEAGVSFFIPVRMDLCENITPRQFCEVLGPVLLDKDKTLIFFNYKFDGERLYNLIGLNKGIDVFSPEQKVIDLRIIFKLKDPDASVTLKELTEKKLKIHQLELEHLFKRTSAKKAVIKFQTLSLAHAIPYAAADSDCTFCIWEQNRAMIEQDMTNQIVILEHKVQKIIAKMEIRGCFINKHLLEKARVSCVAEIARLEKLIKEEAGEDFKINSPRDMASYLYGTLGLQPLEFTDKGAPAVNKNALSPYKETVPFVANVLRLKEASKLLSAFIDKIPGFCDAESVVHPNFNPLGAASGRFSCTDPNFQQLPKQKGSDLDFRSKIRGSLQARPGYILFDMDFSQIEYRVFASLCGDENLAQAYHDGKDFHQATAAMVNGVPYDQVTKLQRTRAKTINFGLLYGLSSYGLAQQLGISEAEAAQMMEDYFADKPKVLEWREKIHEQAVKDKYIHTYFGRRRLLRELYSKDRGVYNSGLRKSVNSLVQGTAADILKIAFVRLDKCIRENNLDVYMLATVHDEVVFEVGLNQDLRKVFKLLQDAMEVQIDGFVPIVAEPEIGYCWQPLIDIKDFDYEHPESIMNLEDMSQSDETDKKAEDKVEFLTFVLPPQMAPIAFSRFRQKLKEFEGDIEFDLKVGDQPPKHAKSKVSLTKEFIELVEDLGVTVKIPDSLLGQIL